MKEKWEEIQGTKREFLRGNESGKVRHKSQMWKEQIWDDGWIDVPDFSGLYRMCVFDNHTLVFSIKRDKLLDIINCFGAIQYILWNGNKKKAFTEKQLLEIYKCVTCH